MHSQLQFSKVRPKREFDHAIKILSLKGRGASLYSVKVIKMSRLVIDRLLFYDASTGHVVVAKQTAQLFCP